MLIDYKDANVLVVIIRIIINAIHLDIANNTKIFLKGLLTRLDNHPNLTIQKMIY